MGEDVCMHLWVRPHPFGREGETLQCFGDRGHGEGLIFPLGFGSSVAAVGSWEFLPDGIPNSVLREQM